MSIFGVAILDHGIAESAIAGGAELVTVGAGVGGKTIFYHQIIDPASDAVRAFATWLLGDRPGAETAKALEGLLADGDSAVRRRACEAFVRSGQKPPAWVRMRFP